MAERPAEPDGHVPELDGLRGLAILAVMVHRMYPRVSGTPWPIEAGWAGVDLFFVISGFLIAGILIDTRDSPGYFRNFYARRVLRIFPLFYLFIGGMLLAFPIAAHEEFLRQAGSPLWYLSQLGNIPESLLGRDPPYWLAPVWSLAIEEQFYLTFPLLVRWAQPRHLARWLVAIALGSLGVRLATAAIAPDRERVQYLFTLCRLDTIAIGCLLAVFVRSARYLAWRARLPRVLAPVIGGVAAVMIWTQLDRTTWFGRTFGYSVLAIGLAALVLLVYEQRARLATAVLRAPLLRYPGKLCFGLYLLHRPADTAVTALVGAAGQDELSMIWLPVKIAVAVVFATASWRIIEQPFLRLKRRFTSTRHPIAAASAPTMIAVLLVVMAGCADASRAGVPPIEAGIAVGTDAPSDARGAGGGAEAGPEHDAGFPDGGSTVPIDAGVPGDRFEADAHAAADAGAPPDAAPPDAPPPHDAAPPDAPPPHDAAPPDAAPPDAPPPPPPGCVLYPEGRLHSPITSDVAAELGRIAALAPGAEQVFGKVGDSITASSSFLACFDGGGDLGSHTALADTLAYFRAGDASGATPFGRTSLAAAGGWTTQDVLAGSPAPIDAELTAIDPRYAVLMLGTNDVRLGRSLDAYGADLWTLVDRARARGAIPVLSTIPAMHGDPGSNARIPLFNRVIRAIAQGRALPLVDLHLAMSTLAGEGISGDGIHPTVAPDGGCALTSAGLAFGYNVRNLLTLEALDRARRARGGEALDPMATRRTGTGAHGDPFLAALPLVDLADTRNGDAGFAGYGACGLPTPGREIVYRLDLAAATAIDAFVVDRDPVDVDIAILAGALAEPACVAAGDQTASATVGPGPVFIVVDSRSAAAEGEFVVIVQSH